jgi:predicted lipoprotein with Yx(FWY)xxD motif
MRLSKPAVAALAVVMLSSGSTLADSHGNEFVHSRTNNGQIYIMYQTHMSLYTFENDEIGKSDCYGSCAKTWPPALLPAGTPLGENYSLIQRTDGSMQAAFKGQPLYLYVGDNKIGDIKGDGVGDVWFLARPDF